jgi:proliferating cell nuclear antigen PCNA
VDFFRVVDAFAASFLFYHFYESILFFADSNRLAEYDMKLMDIYSDTLGIPDTEYYARVAMPSSEFSRIVRDLSQLGESVRIEVSEEGVRFAINLLCQ